MRRFAFGKRLVGRSGELARLEEALSAAGAGSPQVLLITGDAGVGKTRLVCDFIERAADAGVLVLAGWCVDLSGGGLPYGPVVEALRGWAQDVGEDVVRALAGSPPPDLAGLLPGSLGTPERGAQSAVSGLEQSRLFEYVLRLLGRLAADTPVVLVLEDLHWADRATVDLLRFLTANLLRERVLVVATYRSDELHVRHPLYPLLVELDRRRGAERLRLAPLQRREVAELLADMVGEAADARVVDRVYAQCEGNPFFLEEIVAAGVDEHASAVPQTLREVLIARCLRLSPQTQEALRVASAIGREVNHRLLGAACGLGPHELMTALREAVDHQIIVCSSDGTCYRFRHALMREAVYAELFPAERALYHAAIARALETGQADEPRGASVAVETAHHWYLARDDARACASALRAARSLSSVHAFAEAERHFDRVFELWGSVGATTGEHLADLLQEAADAARWAGDPERALTLLRRARGRVNRDTEPERAAELLERTGRCLWEAGESGRSFAAYDEANALLADRPDCALRARILADLGRALMLDGQYVASTARCRDAIAMARAVGARREEAGALITLGANLVKTGRVDEGIAALVEARSLAEDGGWLEELYRAHGNLAALLAYIGRMDESLEAAYAGLASARDQGVELTMGELLTTNAAASLFSLGRWQEAEQVTLDALRRRVPATYAMFDHHTCAELYTARGDFAAATDHLATAYQMSAEVREPQLVGPLRAADAELQIWSGHCDLALQAVDDGLQRLAEGEHEQVAIRLCAVGLRAAADEAVRTRLFGSPAALADALARADRLLSSARTRFAHLAERGAALPEAAVHLQLCEAELSRMREQPDPRLWQQVVDSWDSLRVPYPAAYARWRLAEALLAVRKPQLAAEALRAAHGAARQLGADPLRAEIEALARHARIDLHVGAGAVSIGPEHTQPAAKRLGLTPREREVLSLVANGSTNRQIARTLFISEKTASVHVSNILSKLRVANRGQAAALARRLHLTDTPDVEHST